MDAKYTITALNVDEATSSIRLIHYTSELTAPQFPGVSWLHGGVVAPIVSLADDTSVDTMISVVKGLVAFQYPQLEAMALQQLEMDYIQKTTKVVSKVPEVLTSLTSRRFWLAALEIGITKESLSVTIDGMNLPTLDAQRMKTELMEATEFERDNPVLIALVAYLNIPQAQFDTLWRWAMDL